MKSIAKIGLVSISDRASAGVYIDKGLPALKEWLTAAISTQFEISERLIADDAETITQTLVELADLEHCDLILTTGGTGPAIRDVTPESTLAAGHREMPGFGEQMRQISLRFVPTAILSRQVAVIRNECLIVNLPGQPKAIQETLGGLFDQQKVNLVPGIFAAIPYCLDLIGAAYLETRPEICKAFRPKQSVSQ